ncbi:triose-phosphate isomerase family protein [uncultured Amnibacterium sp.]|uniref:triose-phosphate isomerase family protein n=1 Tax=uncultured Amnibacterium sp. TaxID=1631851 RepID=UPI0035CBE0BC
MTAAVTLGVSLKMYFSPAETATWSGAVAAIAREHDAVLSGRVELFVLPSFPMIPATVAAFAGTAVAVGAQDLMWEDRGAFTGGVSGLDLRALGCRYAEVGHAERRGVFGEDDHIVRRKLAAAVRTGLVPVFCVGERERTSPDAAAAACSAQLAAALRDVPANDAVELVVAYEPEWAIGAEQSASADYIRTVTAGLRDWLAVAPGLGTTRVIYGGSAGPGLLPQLDGAADGLFLGRSAHDPAAVARVLDETLSVR